MVGMRALGLVCSDPQRGHLALHELAGLVGLPDSADAIGVASLVDGSALLSRAPSLPAGQRLADAVGAIQGRCAVAQVRVRGELRPNGADATTSLGPFRARSFAAAIVGGPQDADAAWMSRERLLADVPEFLRRFVAGRSEAEAMFLAILARLHAHGQLDTAQARVDILVRACREVLERASSDPRHIVLTNGVELVHVSAGMPSAILTLDGLSADVAAQLDPALVDSSMGRERLRRFRGIICAGALDAPLKAHAAVPPGVTLQVLPEVAAALVQRDLSVKLI